MITLGLLLSLVIPLLAGLAWISPLSAGRTGGWPLSLGYGYVLGLLITVAGMRAIEAANVPINALTASVLPALVAALGFWKNRGKVSSPATAIAVAMATWGTLPRIPRILTIALLSLIVLRLLTVAAELLPRPFFPWEAISAVAAKARVWYESGSMQQFVPAPAWLQGLGAYTDTDPGALPLPSLLLVWTANLVGEWHEGAVGFPWWLLGVSLTLSFYGHVRRIGGGLVFALTATYLLISLPLVDLNIALAGAPNWVAATGIGLAGCAVLTGLTSPTKEMAVYFLIGATLALATQWSTWPWLLIFAMALIIDRWPRSAMKLFIGVPLLLLLVGLAVLQTPVRFFGGIWQLQVAPDWLESVESLFLLDNWHLLYGLTFLIAIAAWRSVVSPPWLARTWVVGMGLGLMFLLGTLSLPGAWVGGMRQFSTIGLQLAAILLLWLSMVARDLAMSRNPAPTD